jgi:Tfp pilus assembly protein PilO
MTRGEGCSSSAKLCLWILVIAILLPISYASGLPSDFDNQANAAGQEPEAVEAPDEASSAQGIAIGGLIWICGMITLGIVIFVLVAILIRRALRGNRSKVGTIYQPNVAQHQQNEAQRLRQQLAQQQHQSIQLQEQLSKQSVSTAEIDSIKAQLANMQMDKLMLEAELEKETKAGTVVQNITYNIQDSAISGDIKANIDRED